VELVESFDTFDRLGKGNLKIAQALSLEFLPLNWRVPRR
jgi:hypothetical protein